MDPNDYVDPASVKPQPWAQYAARYGFDPNRPPQVGASNYTDNPYTTPDANESASKLYWMNGKPYVSIDPTELTNSWAPKDLLGKIVNGPNGEYLISSDDYNQFANSAPKDTSETGAFLSALGMMAGPLAQAGAFGSGLQGLVSGLPGSGGTFPSGAESGGWGGPASAGTTGGLQDSLMRFADAGGPTYDSPVYDTPAPGGLPYATPPTTPANWTNPGEFWNGGPAGLPVATPPTAPSNWTAPGEFWNGGSAGTATTAATLASRLFSGNPTADDLAKIAGAVGGAGLGALGANAQANAYRDVSNQYLQLGAPSRARLESSYQPGFSLLNEPGFQSAMDVAGQAKARALSEKYGNPAENPGASAELQKFLLGSVALPQLNTYRSQNATSGQLGTNTAGTASLSGVPAASGAYDALGYGLGSLTGGGNDLQSLLKQLQGLGGMSNLFKVNSGGSF